jgi:hypothetical protein
MGEFFSTTTDIASGAGLIVEILSCSFIIEAIYNDRASTSAAASTTYEVIKPRP